MPAWESGFVVAGGLKLHYTRTGGAKPPLVLAHGVTDDGLCWTPIAAALEGAYDVIMVDARAHGRSDDSQQPYGIAELADDLAAVIRGLGLQEPLVLGHSMGAVTALALAGSYPALPRAIVLEDPPGFWTRAPGAGQGEGVPAAMLAWIAGLKRKTYDDLLAEAHAGSPGWPEAEVKPWIDSKLRLSPAVVNGLGPGLVSGVDWAALLPRITCPALLITADPALGAALDPAGEAALKSLVPHLRVEHVAGAGHNIRRDQPARFLAVVRAFLSGSVGA